MLLVPNDASYERLAGSILMGGQYSLQLFILNSQLQASAFHVPIEIEELAIVPTNQNLFAIAYASGVLLGSKATDWQGLEGEIILIEEPTCHPKGSESGIWVLEWPNSSPNPILTNIPLTSDSFIPANAQYEGFTFAPAGILEVPPVVPLCYQLLYSGGVYTNVEAFSIPSPLSSIGLYNYATFKENFLVRNDNINRFLAL